MNKFKFIMLFSLVLLCGCSDKDINSINLKESNSIEFNINENYLFDTINSITIKERSFGSDGEIEASNYLSNKLESYGYNVDIKKFPVYEQDVSYIYNDPKNLNPLNTDSLGIGQHIIATSNNYDYSKQTLYLTAHYDSESDTVGVIDNATGTASLLELARVLEKNTLPFNIKLIFFSAEEHGIYGSRYFTSNLSESERKNALGSINIDMIGEKNAGDITLQTSSGRNNILSIMFNDFYKEAFKILPGGVSDEYAFYISEIPSITLSNEFSKTFDGNNQIDFLDISQLKNITQSIANFIINFDINLYKKTIANKELYDSYNYPKDIMNLNDFKLISIKELLLPTGYDSSYIYKYSDKNDNEYTLMESDSRLVDSSIYKDFSVLDSDNKYVYKVISKKTNDIQIEYKWGSTHGLLISTASIDDSIKLLNSYYINFYKSIFNENPIGKLTSN